MQIIKNVVSKKRMGLTTKIDSKILEADVPMLIRFVNEEEFRRHLATGLIQATNALPPKEIKNIPVIRPPVLEEEIKLVDEVVDPTKEIVGEEADVNVTDKPVVKRGSEVQKDVSNKASEVSKVCPECNNVMIFTTDDKRPGVDLLYCTHCATEIIVSPVVEKTSEETSEETSETKPKKVFSKCSKCGKRKAAADEFCKKCTAGVTVDVTK